MGWVEWEWNASQHKQSSTCFFCGLVPLEDASLLTGASPKSWEIRAVKGEVFLTVCSVCSLLHCTKETPEELVWIHTQTRPSRAEPFAQVSPPLLHLGNPCTPCSKPLHRPRDCSWGRRLVGGQKALPAFRCWKPPEREWSDCQVRVVARKNLWVFFPSCSWPGSSLTLLKSNKILLLYNKNSMF